MKYLLGNEWEADWNGLGGEACDVTVDESGAWLAAGMYRLLVEDEAGCFGQRVFQINNIGADIPEMTIPPMCTGLDTVELQVVMRELMVILTSTSSDLTMMDGREVC